MRPPRLLAFAACILLVACEVGEPPEKASEEEGALSSGDVRVHECIARYPRPAFDFGDIDETEVQQRCVERFGDTTQACDTSRWVSLEAALCVARTAQLDDAHQWRVQLRVSHTFPPSIYYRIRLSEGQNADDERDVDARTGALLWRF